MDSRQPLFVPNEQEWIKFIDDKEQYATCSGIRDCDSCITEMIHRRSDYLFSWVKTLIKNSKPY